MSDVTNHEIFLPKSKNLLCNFSSDINIHSYLECLSEAEREHEISEKAIQSKRGSN